MHTSFQEVLVVINPPANAGDTRDVGSPPGSGRYLGVDNGNPLQYSCLENAMDRGTWQAMVHRVTKSRTQLKRLGMHDEIYASVLTHFLFHLVPGKGL